MNTRLVVSVTDARGRPVAGARRLAAWLAAAAPASARGSVAVALTTDARVRELNRLFRGVDRATDVLSFPVDGPSRPARLLGDIVIARGAAARQARACGHSAATEHRVLALHGLLHLLGYDHESDRGEMRRLEERLRRRAGLLAGLITRAARAHTSR